jgi:hypothetical protein
MSYRDRVLPLAESQPSVSAAEFLAQAKEQHRMQLNAYACSEERLRAEVKDLRAALRAAYDQIDELKEQRDQIIRHFNSFPVGWMTTTGWLTWIIGIAMFLHEWPQNNVMNKLSDYQKGVIDYLCAHGGELRRIAGGFWITSDCKLRSCGSPAGRIPEWGEFFTSTQTVRSLKKKGSLRRTHAFPEEWRDTRKLIS